MIEEGRSRMIKPSVGPYDILEEGGSKNLEYLLGYLSAMRVGSQIEFTINGKVVVFEVMSRTETTK